MYFETEKSAKKDIILVILQEKNIFKVNVLFLSRENHMTLFCFNIKIKIKN